VALAILVAAGAVARPAAAAGPTMAECLAANESAIKLHADHKLIQARDQSLVCAAPSCPARVSEVCQARAMNLTATIPTIVFEVTDPSGNVVTEVDVTMDGQPFAARLDGRALTVDPGDHLFRFAMPGEAKVERHVVISEGDRIRHEKVQLGSAPVAPLVAPAAPTAQSRRSTGLGTRGVVGLTVGGVGAVGLGVGTVFGVMAMSAWSDVKSACQPGTPSRCPITDQPAASSKQSTAQTDGAISTVGFIAGGVLVATGAVLFLTGRHREGSTAPTVAVAPTVGPGQTGFSLTGAF
jgi:hypothetical protein